MFGRSLPVPDLTVTLDPSGRVVLSGFVDALPVDLGGGPLQPLGSKDFVLAELDAAGNHLWSRRFGAPGVSFVAPQVSTSAAGNVQLLTSFAGAVDLGGGDVTATSSNTVFASFTSSGQLRFGRALPIIDAQAKSVDGCGALVVASSLTTFDPGCGQILPVPPAPTWPPRAPRRPTSRSRASRPERRGEQGTKAEREPPLARRLLQRLIPRPGELSRPDDFFTPASASSPRRGGRLDRARRHRRVPEARWAPRIFARSMRAFRIGKSE